MRRRASRRRGAPKNGGEIWRSARVWSLRPDLDFIAFKKEGLGEQGIRSTNDMESIDASEKLIYGVRGAPQEVREKARERGLTLLADATCPFVTQQEEAEIELLNAGCHLVVLSNRTHHGIPRLQGIAREKGKEVFIVEREEDVETIRLTRFEPIGVIVQTTFWMETYKKIIGANETPDWMINEAIERIKSMAA